jgi:hypothetical protein
MKDESTHGAMFVLVIAGSDKTTVSIATGHQEYYLVYTVCHLGIWPTSLRELMAMPCFLLLFFQYQKVCVWKSCFHDCLITDLNLEPQRNTEKPLKYQVFCRQMYHACLAQVFQLLKAGMTTPEVVRCPDGHLCHVIYGLGPYIADYPEQVWLAAIIKGWHLKYVSLLHLPENWLSFV